MSPPESPRISVAMSIYNGERFLVPAIESILAQTFGDFELLALDDGSTDATPDILRDFARRDSRLRPIIRENRGLIASLNQMLHEARAPIIARMDADDICLPQRFERQYEFLMANPAFAVVGAQADDMDEEGNHTPCFGPMHPTSFEDFLATIDTGAHLMCHPVVMFRRDVVLAVGGYHAAFRHCEDLDLWLRLASVTKLCSLPEKLIHYRHYAGQVSSRHATEQQTGAAIARIAYHERLAGRPDPTEHLDRLPPIDGLDMLFGREGISRQVREKVALSLRYSKAGMRDSGFDLLLRHVGDGGNREGLWRTVARLVRFGEPVRALRLAAALATT